jgi:hypothetical protein
MRCSYCGQNIPAPGRVCPACGRFQAGGRSPWVTVYLALAAGGFLGAALDGLRGAVLGGLLGAVAGLGLAFAGRRRRGP